VSKPKPTPRAASRLAGFLALLAALFLPAVALAQSAPPLGAPAWLLALSALPFVLLAVTCFGKISIVLAFLRIGMGAPGVPPTSLLAALAFALTGIVMAPVFLEITAQPEARSALEKVQGPDALSAASDAEIALRPLANFVETHTQPRDTELFSTLAARLGSPGGWLVRVPSFLLSELRDAFRLGLLVLLPFLVIDLLVGVVLYGLGIGQIDPKIVALPLKLGVLLATDGLALILRGLLLSYAS
jgi:flagellar biosynthesis protein FliP